MNEIVTMINSAKLWVAKSLSTSNNWTVIPLAILSALLGIMFPTDAHIISFFVLVFAIFIDTLTRICAEVKNKRKLIGVITSNKLWSGISGKLFVLIILSILLGLTNYMANISIISTGLFTAIYAILFFREFYSVLENLHDAKFTQVDIILKIVKSKEKQMLKDNNIDIDENE